MISQIKVKNFQSHKETTLDLHEGVNALIGLTGAGKSVVFKSLDWLFRNRPLGDEYRSWWGGDTQVEIILEEGQKVGRIRTDSDNFYYIDKKQFRAFGNGPPPQSVLDILNLSETNLQMQSDPSFLISNSAGEVARYLNRTSHLDTIDFALSSIASTLRKEREDWGQTRKDLEQTQEQLLQYEWLPEADEELAGLEKLQEKIAALIVQSSALVIIVEEHERTENELIGLKDILKFGVEVEKLTLLNREIGNQNVRWEQLAAIVDQYEKIGKELTDLIPLEKMGSEVKMLLILDGEIKNKQTQRDGLAKLEYDIVTAKVELESYVWLPRALEDFKRLDNLNLGVGKLRTNKMGLERAIGEIDETSALIKQMEVDYKKLQDEFDRFMPNRCPLCMQEVKK